MMAAFKDLSWQIFGLLLALKPVCKSKNGSWMWLCLCECGKETLVTGVDLTKKDRATRSCGCLIIEAQRQRLTTHGLSKSRTYQSWRSMKSRCINSRDPDYADYGGRGITICEEWAESFENFLQDMGIRPIGTTLDRFDTNGNYEPGNCRWATPYEQTHNRRPNYTHKMMLREHEEARQLRLAEKEKKYAEAKILVAASIAKADQLRTQLNGPNSETANL